MANLSNINNKFIVTDGGQALVNQTVAGFNPDADDLIVGNLSGNTGITIASGSSAGNYGSIYFADAAGSSTASKAGYIRYEQNTSKMTIGINAVEKVAIDLNGNSTFAPTGGIITLGANGHITSKQSLDVATAGGRYVGSSNRGLLGQIRIEQTADSTDGGYIAFDTCASGSTTPTERMRITSAGDINILNATATNSKSIGITNVAGTTGWTFGNGVTANAHQFVIYDNTAGSARMLIDSSGNVTLNSATALDFQVADFAQIKFRESGAITIDSDNDQSSRNFQFKDGSGSSLMLIEDTGNVGIGTTLPQSILSLSKTDEASYTPTTAIDYSLTLGARNGNAGGTSDDLGPGIVWKYNDSGGSYTKKSAGIMQVGEGNYLRSGLAFYTNNNADQTTAWSEKMRLSMDGDLGIGVTSPTARLDILTNSSTGDNNIDRHVRFRADNGEQRFNFFVGRSGNSSNLQMHDSSEVVKIVLNTGDNSYFNGGNVGIGTTGPEHALVAIGSIGFGLSYNGGVYANDTVTGVDENWGLEVQRTANVNDYNTRLKYYPASGESRAAGIYDSRNARFSLYSDTNNNPNIIIPNGNVGIGETSPSNKLQIGQGHSILVGDYFQLGSGSSDIMGALGWNRDTTNGVIYNTNFGAFQMHNNQSVLCLQGYNSSGTNQFEHLFFNNGNTFFDGNVGIGTTTPDYQLDVENSSHAIVRIHAGVNSSASLRLKNDAQDWDLNTQTNDTFAIYNQTSATQPFSILPNGIIGS